MGANIRRVQGNASGRRVPVNVDLAELDRLMVESGPKVIIDSGFTKNDLMARYGLKHGTAERRIQALLISGDIEEIGIRPGKGPQKVYQTVAPAARE